MEEREVRIKAEMIEGMKAAGLDPAHIYAFEQTGLLVVEGNEHLFTPEDRAEWDEAIDEFLASDRDTDLD